ncbi:uncharacterized protein LOC131001694 isoform X2 [Salvia miltiorrhiza]|uniref:uncharacterized protein LOC131001694 isoform X2 n=1 Tax=Salvia miltiorrhiza TaxID=226208 RepID=UPI0025AC9452|nr:uncharacterized protein LOC131001694 isoform X2 [Salvia miltiorrhiza]
MERGSREEADERREAVISSATSLRPNFKPNPGITESQLSKFQELHRRRLQIKAKSKIHKRDKGADGKGKTHKKLAEIQESSDQEPSKPTTMDGTGDLKPENRVGNASCGVDNVAAKTRHKLYWGLDTKERWERKSNM